MRLALLALAAGLALAAPAAADLADSVVKIHATRREPDFLQPWTKQAPVELSGSGVILEGNRILTNAHVVLYARQVYVQPHRSSEKYTARVSVLAPGIDLALLEVDDPALFEGRPPVAVDAVLPAIQDPVAAYGYPMGGGELSITKGIVSRIEYGPYYAETAGLRIQVDAALNPGNSGGPTFSGQRMIGLVFSGIREAENIGYIIPCEEIRRFLEDAADGRWDGIPRVEGELVTLENAALRARLGVPADLTGLVVRDPGPDSPLREWDVITHVDGHALANDGKVLVGQSLRLDFRYLVPRGERDGAVPATVFRAGESLALELPAPRRPHLVVTPLAGEYPRYFVYGPLVFSAATQELVTAVFQAAGPALVLGRSPLVARWRDRPRFAGEELVVLTSRPFTHPIFKGYDATLFATVSSVDGEPVKSLAHLVELLRDGAGRFVEIAFADRGQETLVFERAEVNAATEDILSDNGIRSACSDDLRGLWDRGL